jgi:hypothetical protein
VFSNADGTTLICPRGLDDGIPQDDRPNDGVGFPARLIDMWRIVRLKSEKPGSHGLAR